MSKHQQMPRKYLQIPSITFDYQLYYVDADGNLTKYGNKSLRGNKNFTNLVETLLGYILN